MFLTILGKHLIFVFNQLNTKICVDASIFKIKIRIYKLAVKDGQRVSDGLLLKTVLSWQDNTFKKTMVASYWVKLSSQLISLH